MRTQETWAIYDNKKFFIFCMRILPPLECNFSDVHYNIQCTLVTLRVYLMKLFNRVFLVANVMPMTALYSVFSKLKDKGSDLATNQNYETLNPAMSPISKAHLLLTFSDKPRPNIGAQFESSTKTWNEALGYRR